MRRSRRMASGLCSSAKERAVSGSPVSMMSYLSPRLRRIRRRMDSSSSTTKSLAKRVSFVFGVCASFCVSSWVSFRVMSVLVPLPNQFGGVVCQDARVAAARAAVENVAYLANQDFLGEGLVEQERAFFEHAVSRDEAVGIAGNVENFEFWLFAEQAIGQRAAVHSRHDDICDEEIDRTAMKFRDAECFFTARSRDNLESVIGEKRLRELAESVGVFDEQNGFGAAQIVSWSFGGGLR